MRAAPLLKSAAAFALISAAAALAWAQYRGESVIMRQTLTKDQMLDFSRRKTLDFQ